MTLTDDEIAALAHDLESARVERKASLSTSSKEKVGEAICAFANDLPGHRLPGVVLVGVDDKSGRPVAGFEVSDQLLRDLAAFRSDGNILPLPTMTVETRPLEGRTVAVVIVQPSLDPPVRYYGKVWVRVGPRRAVASREDERVLSERRRSGDLPFDCRPVPGSTLDDLDLELFRRSYLPNAVAAETLAENDRSVVEQLAALHLVADGQPTYGALLLLGRDPRRWLPGAYVQFVRYEGVDLGTPILDQKELGGPLAELLPRVDDLASINIRTPTAVEGGPQELRRPDYPLGALQQLTRNAVLHRTYETNGPVLWYWFSDRIEIHSPGGLYGRVTPETFGQRGITDYRNPTLAAGLKVLGFVQSFGMGIDLARRRCQENGNPAPEFYLDSPHAVLATLRVRP